ncbi:hypothetical protein [Pseudoalteromonas denitrificans]|uniref:Uncharacterized protein n=1 Tax=Pseudoalteromonas denitrificans DSM 6059 TaxID=1123010 RepID=A0A1I1FTQ5_9GAMM|nr:hypothetical protein [Pseudoalteromonas denitrificans]SFC01018.1 hypothetical protein SAMN02745724_00709 [Pseudoalteromonas denitrificans DSM 6059]
MRYVLMLIAIVYSSNAFGDAYCALRDPVAQIKLLYPQKTNQLSIIKQINEGIRQQLKHALPNNDLHFGELGKHTLYVALQEKTKLGYIHVRSEQSQWGLVEIIWAIDKEYRIKDFAFQRCRSPKKKLINNQKFKNMFIGKNLYQLKTYLSDDGFTANQDLLSHAGDAPELANVILRCALKTLLLTELVWKTELENTL